MRSSVLAVFAAAVTAASAYKHADTPWMIHTVITGKAGELAVEWATHPDGNCSSQVEYGPTSSLGKSVTGEATLFAPYTLQHNALLTDLPGNTVVYFRVGGESCGWSETFEHLFAPSGRPLTFAVYGDAGNANFVSLDQLVSDAESGAFDYVLHVGDAAYNMDDEGGSTGDYWMQQIQPIATKVPYLFVVGNHEEADNFSQPLHRFSSHNHLGTNSGSDTMLWYSVDIGLMHYVGISTEVYAYYKDPVEQARQIAWLKEDLAKANANRDQVPWIVVGGHKGFFMEPATNWTEFGAVFTEAKVDLILVGHVHNYERYFPLVSSHNEPVKVDYASVSNGNSTYTNAEYPITVVMGSAGCREDIASGCGIGGDTLITCDDSYGYGQMTVVNSSAIRVRWLQTGDGVEDAALRMSDTAPPSAKDEFWVLKN